MHFRLRAIESLFPPRRRLFFAVLLGLLIFAVTPSEWRLSMRLLIAWDCGALLYMAAAMLVMRDCPVDEMRRRANRFDEPQLSFTILTLLAIVASFVAIFHEFSAAKAASDTRLLSLALGGVTLIISWTLTHTMFTLHYAHLHYGKGPAAGGIMRPEKGDPTYTDLVYFSFLIGCATETSDFMSCNSAIRRFMILHSIVAYVFNVVIVALTISVISDFV
jgi:uncharacterized membrane protein